MSSEFNQGPGAQGEDRGDELSRLGGHEMQATSRTLWTDCYTLKKRLDAQAPPRQVVRTGASAPEFGRISTIIGILISRRPIQLALAAP